MHSAMQHHFHEGMSACKELAETEQSFSNFWELPTNII